MYFLIPWIIKYILNIPIKIYCPYVDASTRQLVDITVTVLIEPDKNRFSTIVEF